ncbi:MAG: chromate efflux transporter [Deltaproteobacteria bacterium]|nr:MAG: chromate efflux transporter [Deltaproteobacteria bacterium]
MESHAIEPPGSAMRTRPRLRDFFRASLLLGVIGFGGGLSVLANIHTLAVIKRRWMTEREFTNTITVAQMLPGGAAANAMAYTGLRFGGLKGAFLGYVGFVAPGWLAVMALAFLYVHFGTTPDVATLLGGFNAAVVGVIGAITLKMARTAVGRLWQMGVAAGALLFSVLGDAPPGEVALLAIGVGLAVDLGTKRARLLAMERRRTRERREGPVVLPEEGATLATQKPEPPKEMNVAPWTVFAVMMGIALHAPGVDAELVRIAFSFFRTGLGAYGGGFAIVPHLKQVVEREHWISERQFADAVAIGKLTPGPVLLLATFIGYLRHGWLGAVVATIGIFAAPFALVATAGTWLDRIRSRRPVRAALRGLTPAVLGLMAAAVISLGDTINGEGEIAIAIAVCLTLSRFEINPAVMLALGGAARFAFRFAGL